MKKYRLKRPIPSHPEGVLVKTDGLRWWTGGLVEMEFNETAAAYLSVLLDFGGEDWFEEIAETPSDRVGLDREYYSLTTGVDGQFYRTLFTETGSAWDKLRYSFGTYFIDKEEAQQMADKFNAMLKINQVTKRLNGDWEPDWNNASNLKYHIEYDHESQKLTWAVVEVSEYTLFHYKNVETAQQAIKELEKEYKVLFGITD